MTIMQPIPSLLTGYFAGDDGHLYSTLSRWGATEPRQLSESLTHDGYLRARVVRERGKPVRWQAVAPMVAEAFLGPKPEGQQVRHLNGDKRDNRPGNLTYGTALDNARDRDQHGTTVCGERSRQSRHTDEERRRAVARVLAGETRAAVARDLGVHKTCVQRWCAAAQAGHRIYQWRGVAA